MKCVSRIGPLSAAVWIVMNLVGCASPPSTSLLIGVANKVIADEQTHLQSDAEQQSQWYEQQRALLAAAFDADLAQHDTIDPQWLKSGLGVYVTARETLVRREVQAHEQLAVRRQNLQLAGQALSRAMAIMQQQDRLLWAAPQLRQWIDQHMQPSPQTHTETSK